MKFEVGDDFSKTLFGDDTSREVVSTQFGDEFSSISDPTLSLDIYPLENGKPCHLLALPEKFGVNTTIF